MKTLRDIQSESDKREIPLKRVGIKNIQYPLKVRRKDGGSVDTIATFNLTVNLPHHFRGTHMSRFIEVLEEFSEMLSWNDLKAFAMKLRDKLNAEASHIEILFPYLVRKKAPVSGKESYMNYDAHIEAVLERDTFAIYTGVKVPVHTLCPCSKAISKYGAHNQRAFVDITVKTTKLIWLEEIIETAEKSASHGLYALLKRVDEKHLTEYAYDHPKFVEDVARDAALLLKEDDRIEWFKVEVESMESIHNHQAYACVVWERGNGFWEA